jgi:hypothetical protein
MEFYCLLIEIQNNLICKDALNIMDFVNSLKLKLKDLVAKSPQKGVLRQIKPYIKKIDLLLERIFQGNKFEITSTEVLLMGVIIMLICLTIELAEQAKNPKVIVKTIKEKSEKSD